MSAVFTTNDDSFRTALDRQGYAVVEALSPADVRELTGLYQGQADELSGGFQATMFSRSRELRERIYRELQRLVEPVAQRWLPGYRVAVGNFVVKAPGAPESRVAWHQDWCLVEPGCPPTYNFWCPLIDVDQHNGCLWMLSGSHRLFPHLRAHGDLCPFDRDILVEKTANAIALPMTAGQAVVYAGDTIHGSAVNQGAEARVAVGCVLAPPNSALIYCHRVSPREVAIYEVDESFFWTHQPGETPGDCRLKGVATAPIPTPWVHYPNAAAAPDHTAAKPHPGVTTLARGDGGVPERLDRA